MKNLKVLLPMLAFIFAIGMAFATTDLKEEPKVQAFDYILVDGEWEPVPEQNCGVGNIVCQVQFGQDGTPQPLYENMGDRDPKTGSSEDPIIL